MVKNGESSFVKIGDQKNLSTTEKGVNWIEYQGEILYTMVQNCQIMFADHWVKHLITFRSNYLWN